MPFRINSGDNLKKVLSDLIKCKESYTKFHVKQKNFEFETKNIIFEYC